MKHHAEHSLDALSQRQIERCRSGIDITKVIGRELDIVLIDVSDDPRQHRRDGIEGGQRTIHDGVDCLREREPRHDPQVCADKQHTLQQRQPVRMRDRHNAKRDVLGKERVGSFAPARHVSEVAMTEHHSLRATGSPRRVDENCNLTGGILIDLLGNGARLQLTDLDRSNPRERFGFRAAPARRSICFRRYSMRIEYASGLAITLNGVQFVRAEPCARHHCPCIKPARRIHQDDGAD